MQAITVWQVVLVLFWDDHAKEKWSLTYSNGILHFFWRNTVNGMTNAMSNKSTPPTAMPRISMSDKKFAHNLGWSIMPEMQKKKEKKKEKKSTYASWKDAKCLYIFRKRIKLKLCIE